MPGSGGVNSWPDYMQYAHGWWLSNMVAMDDAGFGSNDRTTAGITFNMDADVNSARGVNPYSGAGAFDPTFLLRDVDTKLATLESKVLEFSPDSDFRAAIQTARDEISGSTRATVDSLPDLEIDDEIESAANGAENKARPEMLRAVGRLAAQFLEANAVNTTGFAFGVVDLERQHQDKITDLRDKLRSTFHETKLRYEAEGNLQTQKLSVEIGQNVYETETKFALAGASEVLKGIVARLMLFSELASKELETNKVEIVAHKERNDMDLSLDVKSKTWNLDLYAYAGNLLAAQSGGVYRTAGDASTWEKILSGILGGASAAGTVLDVAGEFKKWGDPDAWFK